MSIIVNKVLVYGKMVAMAKLNNHSLVGGKLSTCSENNEDEMRYKGDGRDTC